MLRSSQLHRLSTFQSVSWKTGVTGTTNEVAFRLPITIGLSNFFSCGAAGPTKSVLPISKLVCFFCVQSRLCSYSVSTRNTYVALSQHYARFISKRHCSRCTFIDRTVPPGFRSHPPWRVLFFGSDEFSVRHLDALVQTGLSSESNRLIDTLEVVTNSVNHRKPPSTVHEYAVTKGLTIHHWPLHPVHNKYDVGVVASFGHLIPADVIHMFPYGILNVHPSLLPRWRGASPITHTVLNGDEITGVSIMEIRPKRFDIGPLLMSQRFYVPPRVTTNQLASILASLGAHMLLHTLENLPWLEIAEKEQAKTGITYAHKVLSVMANIDWNNQTCFNIDCQYRALCETMRLRSEYNGQTVHLLDMVSADSMDSLLVKELYTKYPVVHRVPNGLPHYSKTHKLLCIKCKDGWVGFKRIVLHKTMSANDFNNGFLSREWNQGKVFKSIGNNLNKDIHRERMLFVN